METGWKISEERAAKPQYLETFAQVLKDQAIELHRQSEASGAQKLNALGVRRQHRHFLNELELTAGQLHRVLFAPHNLSVSIRNHEDHADVRLIPVVREACAR